MFPDFSIDGDGSKYCARVRRPGNIPHLIIILMIIFMRQRLYLRVQIEHEQWFC